VCAYQQLTFYCLLSLCTRTYQIGKNLDAGRGLLWTDQESRLLGKFTVHLSLFSYIACKDFLFIEYFYQFLQSSEKEIEGAYG
jgi:hypothetical protein